MDKCVFSAMASDSAAVHVVYEDKLVFAIPSLEQPNPYEVLVIPRAHVEMVYDLTDEQASAIFQTTVKLARVIRELSGCEGMNPVQSNGTAGQQDVFYFHLHIVPRFTGDAIVLEWDNTPAPAGTLRHLASEIRAKL